MFSEFGWYLKIMEIKQKVLIAGAILVLFSLCLLIVFGDNGLAELKFLKKERDALAQKNEQIALDNLSLFREIKRLETDLSYIESVARRQLGFIGKDEIILKLNDSNGEKP